jgi:hypothetical protein
MNCPKCDGGAYTSEEEVVSVLENAVPARVIMKITYICKSCGERFTRVLFEDIEGKRIQSRTKETRDSRAWKPSPGMPTSEFAAGPGPLTLSKKEPEDKLKFLDDL